MTTENITLLLACEWKADSPKNQADTHKSLGDAPMHHGEWLNLYITDDLLRFSSTVFPRK